MVTLPHIVEAVPQSGKKRTLQAGNRTGGTEMQIENKNLHKQQEQVNIQAYLEKIPELVRVDRAAGRFETKKTGSHGQHHYDEFLVRRMNDLLHTRFSPLQEIERSKSPGSNPSPALPMICRTFGRSAVGMREELSGRLQT